MGNSPSTNVRNNLKMLFFDGIPCPRTKEKPCFMQGHAFGTVTILTERLTAMVKLM